MNHREIERWYRRRTIMKACWILGTVSLVVVAISYGAAALLRDRHEEFDSEPVAKPGIRIKNFSYSSPGAHPWELKADSAVVSESLDKVSLTQPVVSYLGGRGGAIVLSSKTGDLLKEKQEVTAKGDVLVKFRDFTFSADQVHYSHEKIVADTPTPVSLEAKDMRVSGKGMILSLEREEVTIEDDVKAQIFNVPMVGADGRFPM